MPVGKGQGCLRFGVKDFICLFLGVWVLEVGYGRGEGKGDPC